MQPIPGLERCRSSVVVDAAGSVRAAAAPADARSGGPEVVDRAERLLFQLPPPCLADRLAGGSERQGDSDDGGGVARRPLPVAGNGVRRRPTGRLPRLLLILFLVLLLFFLILFRFARR